MKKKLSRLWIVLLVVVCCLGPFIFTVAENRYNKYVFERMLEESKYIVEEELPIWLGTERLTINASCTFSSRINDNSGKFYWRDYCETTIYVDDELDGRSDKEQHSFLSNVEDNIEQYIQIIMKKHYPQYTEYDETFGILHNAYGKRVSRELIQKIIVKTSHNTYEFIGDNNYYKRNGKIVSLSTTSHEPIQIHQMPYVGMLESSISFTSLGNPTTKEKCKDFDALKASHRWTEYRWYEDDVQDLEHLKCIAKVWYYKHDTKVEVPGYVYDVVIYD